MRGSGDLLDVPDHRTDGSGSVLGLFLSFQLGLLLFQGIKPPPPPSAAVCGLMDSRIRDGNKEVSIPGCILSLSLFLSLCDRPLFDLARGFLAGEQVSE